VPYIQNTKADQAEMLEAIGAESIEELFSCIPDSIRFEGELGLPEGASEPEVKAKIAGLGARTRSAARRPFFLGAGVYHHHIPSMVDHLAGRAAYSHEHINPARLDEEADSEHRRALFAFAEEHGFPRLQEVLTCGQYRHPRGMQFGGVEPEASNQILRGVAAGGCRGARHVAWIDLHTGLGEFGALEMITESPPDAPDYARGRAWYGAHARSTRGGESVSAPLNGTMERGLEEALGAEVELTAYAAEFGTYPALRVFQAMRADNWLQHHGERESEQGRAIKRELLEVFRPDDARWRAQMLAGAARVIQQALDGLARA